MTAQIGILNKNAVVLATDSAVTIADGKKEKAFNTAEKLFELVRNKPVGIMIYNAAEFNGVPWEIFIKDYGRKHTNDSFFHLEEYKIAFFDFLSNNNLFIDEAGELLSVCRLTDEISNLIFEALNEKLAVAEIINENIVLQKLHETIFEFDDVFGEERVYEKFKPLIEIDYLEKYRPVIENIVREKVNFNVSDEEFGCIVQLIEKIIYSDYSGDNYTGVVIAGYGEDDYFPRLYQTEIFLCLNGILKVKEYSPVIIGKGISEEESTAALRPFAQHDMVDTFMRGITPALNDYMIELFSEVLEIIFDESRKFRKEGTDSDMKNLVMKAKRCVIEEIEKTERQHFINPVIDMLGSLGKQQLAEMAETLIELTSFKRKISMDTESVGGPVDIAIISKHEGFIWIKRKHYFDLELNPAYIERRNKDYE